MIEIQQLKLPITHDSRHLKEKVCRMLNIKEEQLLSLEILRQSIDARKKQEISYVSHFPLFSVFLPYSTSYSGHF